jgi:hypothetical protein
MAAIPSETSRRCALRAPGRLLLRNVDAFTTTMSAQRDASGRATDECGLGRLIAPTALHYTPLRAILVQMPVPTACASGYCEESQGYGDAPNNSMRLRSRNPHCGEDQETFPTTETYLCHSNSQK